jgi:hypothetical protein
MAQVGGAEKGSKCKGGSKGDLRDALKKIVRKVVCELRQVCLVLVTARAFIDYKTSMTTYQDPLRGIEGN